MKIRIESGRDYQGKIYYALVDENGNCIKAGYSTLREAVTKRKELAKQKPEHI